MARIEQDMEQIRVDLLANGAAIVVSAIACVTDLRTRRIPNRLTFGAAAAAIVIRTLIGGWSGALSSVGGCAVGLALFLPLFVLGGMGGGDVKLVGALGAWLGPAGAIQVDLYSALAGGAFGVIVALARGYLSTAFLNLRLMTMSWMAGSGTLPGMTLAEAQGPRLAYALPIAAGTMVTLWLR